MSVWWVGGYVPFLFTYHRLVHFFELTDGQLEKMNGCSIMVCLAVMRIFTKLNVNCVVNTIMWIQC
jgi:uncharacterized protein YkvS